MGEVNHECDSCEENVAGHCHYLAKLNRNWSRCPALMTGCNGYKKNSQRA